MTNFKQDIQNHNVERALRLLSTEVKDSGDLQKSVEFLSTIFNDGLLKGFIDDIGHKNFFDKLDVVVDELCKARKDLSKLKKVQKMVTRGGRTFIQTFYEEIESSKVDKKIGLYDLPDDKYQFIVNTPEYKQAYSDYLDNNPKPTLKDREGAHSFALNFAYEKRKHQFSEQKPKKTFEEFIDEDTGEVVNIERNIEIHPMSVKAEIENKIRELQDKIAPIRDERNKVYDEVLELKFEIEGKKGEVRELQKQLRQAHFDQEQDIVNAQEVSFEEADRVIQEYSVLMNGLETQISTLAQAIPPLVKRYNERDEALMDIEDDMEPIKDEIVNLKTKLDTMTFEVPE